MAGFDFGKFASEVGRSASGFLNQAKESVVKAVDQNGDGELNLDDAAMIVDSIGSAVNQTADKLRNDFENMQLASERKSLQPIFQEDLEHAEFRMPKLLCIAEVDKKRAESAVCQGSIGYWSNQKELSVICIFRHCTELFGLEFYPDKSSDLYYVDPSDRNRYIALEDYFSYLKIARINELQRIAQDLGAKHFRVTYKETSSSQNANSVHVKADAKAAKDHIGAGVGNDYSESNVAKVEIAAEMECPGHEPVEPQLHYLQLEQSVLTLISLRMNPMSPLQHQRFIISLNNSSGMKEKEAAKVDAAVRGMKLNGSLQMVNEAKREEKRFLEYEIDF